MNQVTVNRFVICAVVLVACAFALLFHAEPPEGTVQGICTDKATKMPLVNTRVYLSKIEADDTSSSETSSSQETLSAPFGWSQASQNDDSMDFTGKDKAPNYYFSARTDAAGRFTMAHVPAGKYRIETYGRWSEDNERDVMVEADKTSRVTLDLTRPESSIEFQSTTPNWLPSEKPQIALHGTLWDPKVELTLSRLDVAGQLAHQPLKLLNLREGDRAAKKITWPGQYTQIRKWSYTANTHTADGTFFQRLPLDTLPEGLYQIKAHNSETDATSWILITHLALVRKSYGSHALAYVTDLETGKPAKQIKIGLYTGEDTTARAVHTTLTSHDGMAKLDLIGGARESSGVIVAQEDDSLAMVSVDMNSPGDENSDSATALTTEASSPGALRSFIYTDRPIYRPGHTVEIKGISRWAVARKTGAYAAGFAIPANQEVLIDIRDAQDTLVSHLTLRTNEMGSWNTTLPLSDEALTGEYTINATIGGQTSSGTFVVAAYRKPEYQAKITFDKKRYVRGDVIHAQIAATYYFGSPVAAATAYCTVYRTDDWGGYDPDETSDSESSSEDSSTSGEPIVEQTVRLDERGIAHLTIPTADGPEKQDQTYSVHIAVTDPANRSVDEVADVSVGQGLFSLHVVATPTVCPPNTPIKVAINALDLNAAPQKGQELTVDANYHNWVNDHEQIIPVSKTDAQTSSLGEAEAIITASRSGLLVVTVSGKDARGNPVSAESEIWVLSTDEDIPVQYPDLSVKLDRKKYDVGQTAHLLINTEHPGPTALITVEGATLHKAWTVPLDRRSTGIDLDVDEAYAPGVTISVCCVWDKQFLSSSSHLTVDDTQRKLQVLLSSNAPLFHPGDKATVSVQTLDAKGHPASAEVSLAVVDSSVYAIREDNGPTIGESLQPDQGDAVQTSSSCEPIYLGDVDKGDADISLRKKFPDTALWLPDLRTDAQGKATVTVDLPDTLTTWRVTGIGHTRDTAVGKGITTFIVNKDLLVRLDAPSFFVAGDKSQIAALVNNNTSGTLQAETRLHADGLGATDTSPKTLSVASNHSARADWSVNPMTPGDIDLSATTRSGTLTDGLGITVPVLPHGWYQSIWNAGSLRHRITKTANVASDAVPNTAKLRIHMSRSVSSSLLPALNYLATYPYGSTDATVSVMMSNISAAEATQGATPAIALGPTQKSRLTEMTQRSLLRLYRFQREDGGWAWWSRGEADLWMTAYATWGLTRAKDAGYTVTQSVLDAAGSATADQAKQWIEHPKQSYDTPSGSALAALALARVGTTDRATQLLTFIESRWSKDTSKIRYADLAVAALAEQSLGHKTQANALMKQIWAGRQRLGSLTAWPSAFHTLSKGATQDQPEVETTAWCLLAAEAITPSDPRLDEIARWLMVYRTGDYWVSTRTTAIVLQGLSFYATHYTESDPNFDVNIVLNNTIIRTVHFTPESSEQPDVMVEIPSASLQAGENSVTFDKTGDGRMYYSMEMRQCIAERTPQAPPSFWKLAAARLTNPASLDPPFSSSGYRLKRQLLRTTSRRNFLWEDTVPTPDTRYLTGDTMLVRLVIDCARPSSHLVVEEPIPAGCTITDTSADSAEDWDNWWDYNDIRDDKIVFFIQNITRGRHIIEYHLRAQTPGQYDVMPTSVTGMFDPTLQTLGQSSRIFISQGKVQ